MSEIPQFSSSSEASHLYNRDKSSPDSQSLQSLEMDQREGDLSTTPSSPIISHDKNFDEYTPKSPSMSSDSIMNITPLSSNPNINITDNEHDQIPDEAVIYSDSDLGSQNSVNSPHYVSHNSSASETDSTKSNITTKHRKKKRSTPNRSTNSRRGSVDSTPNSKSKKQIRRKSKASDHASEKSARSSIRHHNNDYAVGSGYTLTPATGKIFRNLLILEESLREQVIQQRALRRKYLTFLAVLCSLIASISHHLYFNNDSNASSSSGAVRVILQFTLLALLVTLMLYHLSGEYQKTIVLPRKFLSSTNKGLRQLNVRLVKIKTPLTDNIIDLIREFLLLMATMCLNSLHKVYPSIIQNKHSKLEVFLVSCQLQCQPRIGVTDVKLVLNARVFNTDVREGWELYRSEFWIHEGVRRRNAMMAFSNGNYAENSLDRTKLLKKDKKDRKDRRKSSVLSEKNLNNLGDNSDAESPINLTPYQSNI